MDSAAYLVPDWPAPPNVRALTTTRRMPGNSLPPYDAFNLGLRTGEGTKIVRANRALLMRALSLPSEPCWLRQEHAANVIVIDAALPGSALSSEPPADAAISRAAHRVLTILTADCLPILLCADDGAEIAAVHAGWRGLAAGVIEACVARLISPPERMMAWLGPAIGPASYEVGEEVRAAFVDAVASAAGAFTATRPGHWLCDLYTLARQRLAALGVDRIHGGGFDTFTDSRFYSYRRDGARSGRFATLICINEAAGAT